MESLYWLGLDWDKGPFFQSKRTKIYRDKAEYLVKKGKAYFCYCTPEEIQSRRQSAQAEGRFFNYDRLCYYLPEEKKKECESEGKSRAVRFLVPDEEIKYEDIIHGPTAVKSENIEDFVLLRRDGLPTYHLSVVVDDMEQGITLILRGDDHISNTPKQILLYKAFGAEVPEFAHMPLILGPDKKKLSKRHGVTSIFELKEKGYFPLAVLNFLAQMSWTPGEEDRIYTLEEMAGKFSLAGLSKNSPVFDYSKLEWFNSRCISQMELQELAFVVKTELEKEELWQEKYEKEEKTWFIRLLDLLKDRSRFSIDFVKRGRPFFSDNFEYEIEAVSKYLKEDILDSLIPKLADDFNSLEEFSSEKIEEVLRRRAEAEGVKAALFIHAVRVLALGMRVSPGIFDVLELLGREKTVKRMAKIAEIRARYLE
jgi:glutamyl-tRNA synthetase/nondiscriminating glutamyl-tRNA synthetase